MCAGYNVVGQKERFSGGTWVRAPHWAGSLLEILSLCPSPYSLSLK